MRTINLTNIAIIVAITAINIGVGTYERLVPNRGVLYFLQNTVLASHGAVTPGFTSLNVTNSGDFIMMNTMANANMGSSMVLFVLIVLVAVAITGILGGMGGRR